ncbi:MAG: hypothetical protein JXA14_21150, partial [Anaerolineae bacterium]|nr:hypothetical protein [Anaerolineae bacterium]
MTGKAFAQIEKPEKKASRSVSNKLEKPSETSSATPYDQITRLQRTIGSQAVRRLLESGALQAKQVTPLRRQVDEKRGKPVQATASAPALQRLTVKYPSSPSGSRQGDPTRIGNADVASDVTGSESILQRLTVTYPDSPIGSRQSGPTHINSTYSVRWTAFIRDDTLCFEFEKVARDAATITVNLYDDQGNGWLGSGAVSWVTDERGYKYVEFTDFPN